MKTLIVYASKYGCTADCAAKLKNLLSGDIALADINKIVPNVHDFNTVIIGGSVYIGKISKKLKIFCESNLNALLEKQVGIFLCCALKDQVNEVLTSNFPPALLTHSKVTETFGSEARLDKMSFLDKTIIKAVTKGDFSSFKISDESIEAFAKKLN